ncbi:MAG: TolC family protein, partial [Candidatus Cryptobacteroides sp.]
MKRFLALVLALISLNACSLYKKYDRELVAKQDLFGEINLPDSNSLATLPWKEVFTDPCLQELIDTALARNSDLLSAQHNVQEAMQRLKVARLGYLPSLNVGAQANWSSLSAPSWSIAGTASWQIDLFGAQTNVKRQSEANLEWSEDYKLAVQSSLIAALASNYYSLQVLDAELEIAAQTSVKFQESVRVLKAMKAAGMANEIAVAQMEAAYHEVNSAQKDLQES